MTKIQKRVIKRIEKYSTTIINHAPQAYFHKKSYISFLHIGIPCSNVQSSKVIDLKEESETVRIIHIPSKAGPKGSHQILEIINRLRKNYSIDYLMITGIANEEVLKIISTADIAIDEYYSDMPMAVFATECAFQKVPVVVGGYYAEVIHGDYLYEELPPSMFVLPENMESAVEKLIVDKDFRVQLGKRAFDFVTENWSASVIADKYIRLIKGEIPQEWILNPYDLTYLYGCGLSKEQVKENRTLAYLLKKE